MNRKVATAIVVLGLLIMAGVPARADASSTDQAQTDLSSLPKIEAYLGTMGISLDSVVVQQGQLNYAGPDCPGAEWNCTTATMVVQMTTSRSAANVFQCLPSANATFPAPNECLIVQSSALDPLETATTTNSAECTPDIAVIIDPIGPGGKSKSKCTVRQTAKKGNNYAVVRMRTTQRGGSPQSVTQEADIMQSNGSGSNTVKITQTILQELDAHETAAVPQEQDARQSANVNQTSVSGANSADVQQTMRQQENARSDSDITQLQNSDSTGPDQETTVTQTSTSGTNTSNLRWQLTQGQVAVTSAGCVTLTCTVTQRQGSDLGGQKGTVIQTTGLVVMVSIADQNEDQQQKADTAGTLIRSQDGPEFCCAEQNGGTADNKNMVTQLSVQDQTPVTFGSQFSRQDGHCSQSTPGALCTVKQTYTVNDGEPDEFSETDTVVANDRFCSPATEGNPCVTD